MRIAREDLEHVPVRVSHRRNLTLRKSSQSLAGRPGFEPEFHAPKACVLPLDDLPRTPAPLPGNRAARILRPASLFKQPLLILVPRNGEREKHFPSEGDELRGATEFPVGIEEGENGRAAPRQ